MNFDDNAIFRRPEILKLRDLNEEDPAEIEAKERSCIHKIEWVDRMHGKWCRLSYGDNGYN